MDILKKMFTVASLLVFSQASYCESLKIPIKIDNPTSFNKPWPITCGVPFPKGKLKDTSSFAVIDKAGKSIPCQFDITATWLEDGSIRWVLLNYVANPRGEYFLTTENANNTSISQKIQVQDNKENILINTGAAEFIIDKNAALISEAKVNGKSILKNSVPTAYLIDNKGRKAVLGGKSSEMESRFLLQGPLATVLRQEGWYTTEKGEHIARGIVWLYFYGNSPYVKLVHKLVLTENTNEVWFKDIGINFSSAMKGNAEAAFPISKSSLGKIETVSLKDNETVWMMQDDFPHFMSKSSHFSLTKEASGEKKEISSGEICGDWCNLSSGKTGFSVVLRDFAEQYPKEFTVSRDGINLHLWAPRSGKELDFRTPALIKNHWGEWANYANITLDELSMLPSNAQASAKTHILWLLPDIEGYDKKEIADTADTAAKSVLAFSDPKWTCKSEAMGPAIHPKDEDKFSEEERFISKFFDELVLPNRLFPMSGYLSWGANPCTRYSIDSKTGKLYAVWWRVSLTDYYLKYNAWMLYLRSGERKYFDFAEHFDRHIGDMNMHNWDVPKDKTVKGGFVSGNYPKDFENSVVRKDSSGKPVYWREITRSGGGAESGAIPIYWGPMSVNPTGSGAGLMNNLCHFYLTGDWDLREIVENYTNAVKKTSWLQMSGPVRGAFVYVRCYLDAYSLEWDKQMGELARKLSYENIDMSSPNAITMKAVPYPTYKIGRNAIAMLDYYRLTGDEKIKNAFIKMGDYDFRFGGAKPGNPIGYQDATAMIYTMLYNYTGDSKYFSRAAQTIKAGIEAEEEFIAFCKKENKIPFRGQCFNYQACLNMPVLLEALSRQKDKLNPVPFLVKAGNSTSNAWAVFKKETSEKIKLEITFEPVNADIEIFMIGPDMKPFDSYKILKKEKGIENPFEAGITPYYFEIEIPADAPLGTYRLGEKNAAAFIVINANTKQMTLECPEGFWLSGYTPFYFKVTEKLEKLNVFTELPVKITRSDNSTAKALDNKTSGLMEIPVEGKSGFWKIENNSPAYVRLINIPPIVSSMSQNSYFIPEKLLEPQKNKLELPEAGKTFVKGVIDSALQLTDKKTLRIARGEKLPDGTYKNFPSITGTIEFYFRPNWNAVDNYFASPGGHIYPLVSGGCISVRYRYGQTYMTSADFELLCGRTKFKSRGKVGSLFGNHAYYYPRAGEWIHVAATWDVTDTAQKYDSQKYDKHSEQFHVFVNGKLYKRINSSPGRLKLYLGDTFAKDFDLSDIPEWITLGPENGSFDELRISDTVRYNKDFTPPAKQFNVDKNTKLLIHFDDSLDAQGTNGKIQTELK
ncbi:MAG: hypothetical protein A2017_10900 [Lentisphaerae bacterium GWF2_44_16]|nr:MAG: hypothetical protein A2017_10900 [Lentisphaerae bacterium GWF2_44_16]